MTLIVEICPSCLILESHLGNDLLKGRKKLTWVLSRVFWVALSYFSISEGSPEKQYKDRDK